MSSYHQIVNNYIMEYILEYGNNELIENIKKYLENDDYVEYYKAYKQAPESFKNYPSTCKTMSGAFPDALQLTIENGNLYQFQELRKTCPFINYNDYITDCAFYGKLDFLEEIMDTVFHIYDVAKQNAHYISCKMGHYFITAYLSERGIFNILTYNHLIKNPNDQNRFLLEKYGRRMAMMFD